MPHGRGGLHEEGKSGENTFGLTRVLEPVSIALSVRVVAHDFGQAQCAEHVADSLDAPATARAISLGVSSRVSASSCTTANATGFPSSRHRRDCL